MDNEKKPLDTFEWLTLLADVIQFGKYSIKTECAGRVLAIRDELASLRAENERLRAACEAVIPRIQIRCECEPSSGCHDAITKRMLLAALTPTAPEQE